MAINEVTRGLGMIGLGTMGRNMALNLVGRGCRVAGFDPDPHKRELFLDEGGARGVSAAANLRELIGKLESPRVLMMLVPAGPPVEDTIRQLRENLAPGDIAIDGGNSHFRDTELHQRVLGERGIHLLGFGISGGEAGARTGPSIMAGGPAEAWEQVRTMFEAAAAHAEGEPCAAWMGPGGAGHFVKMVHNGIEYGLMELIAESYDLMKRGLGMSDDDLHGIFDQWAESEIGGFLVEITAEIFLKEDPLTGRRLIDLIRGVARQKGTGIWTSREALELKVPTPTIDISVAMRDLSSMEEPRAAATRLLSGPSCRLDEMRGAMLERIRGALMAGMILTYGQGFALLHAAVRQYEFGTDLEAVARVWRAGCIIRSRLVPLIVEAFQWRHELPLIFLAPALQHELTRHQADLRYVACAAGEAGIPAPAMMTALAYYDAWRSTWLPDNLIQAQRDYFGAHTYERIDRGGVFHTQW